MTTDTILENLTGEGAIVEQASRGVALAVDELGRRHGETAWRFAHAVTGDPTAATAAVANGMTSALTAVHAGRAGTDHFLVLLLVHVRNAAVDLLGDTAQPVDDSILAAAFADVPERWRSATWLSVVTQLSGRDVATVIGLEHEETIGLIARARMGIRQRYLAAHVAESGDRNCSRAVARLGAAVDHTLPAADLEKVERHLRLCEGCTERRALLVALPVDLAALAGAPPADLAEKIRFAVAPLGVPATSSGMSERTERVLAGASAFAAVVGVLSAALFGLGNADNDRSANMAVSPIAPLVTEVVSPRTVDLTSAFEFPATTIASRAAEDAADDAASSATATDAATGAGTSGGQDLAAEGPGGPIAGPTARDLLGGGDGSEDGDSVIIGTTVPVLDLPVAVEIGTNPDDIGATVGPVSVGSQPEPPDSTAASEESSSTDEVIEVVEPVATQVAPATDDTVGSVTGSLGL